MSTVTIRAAPRHPVPPLWHTLAHFLALTPGQERRWWDAVVRARWSPTASWRQALVLFEEQPPTARTPDAIWAFFLTHCTPQRLVALLEDVKHERLLSHAEVAEIEESILSRLDREGFYTPTTKEQKAC